MKTALNWELFFFHLSENIIINFVNSVSKIFTLLLSALTIFLLNTLARIRKKQQHFV